LPPGGSSGLPSVPATGTLAITMRPLAAQRATSDSITWPCTGASCQVAVNAPYRHPIAWQ